MHAIFAWAIFYFRAARPGLVEPQESGESCENVKCVQMKLLGFLVGTYLMMSPAAPTQIGCSTALNR
jgi:hypothetical protein